MSLKQGVLTEDQIKQINETLLEIIKESRAQCIFLVEENGRLVTKLGSAQTLDTASLARQLADQSRSLRELAQLAGGCELCALFPNKKTDQIYIYLLGDQYIFIAIFDDKTTIMEVRLSFNNVGKKLNDILGTTPKR